MTTEGIHTAADVPTAIEARGVGVRYGDGWALRDCTFSVPRGAVALLAGPNGAGKSSLLSVAAGLTVPAAGELFILGDKVSAHMHPRAGFVSQKRSLPASLTVRDVLRMGRSLNGGDWAAAEFVEKLLTDGAVPLGAKAGNLSEGARSLLAMALALARRADVLLLDEPFAAIDPLARDELLRMLMSEVADRGMTLLMSSHVPGELRDICDHLVLLSVGRLALAGPIDDLIDGHRVLVGPASADPPLDGCTVIHRSVTGRQASLLVRGRPAELAGWDYGPPSLEALVLDYLRAARGR